MNNKKGNNANKSRDFKKKNSGKYSKESRDRNNAGDKSGSKCENYDTMHTNDISWYNKMTNLFARATQIPFNRILGDNMADPEIAISDYTTDNPWFRKSVPIAMTLRYIPGIGVCDDYNDAPNRAFQSMYSALLTKTSTSTLPFTAANLALYTVCAQSIAQNIGLAKRLIETTRVYTPDNLGLPRGLIQAHFGSGVRAGVDELINNVGKYEWELNNLIRDFNSLRIPNFIDTFKRQYLLAHSYFMDNDTVGSQAYVFVPRIYYVFNDLGHQQSDDTYDGIARAESKTINVTSIENVLTAIREQLEKLRSSKDFTSINGTLKRAFDDSDFVHIDELVGNELPNFIVDETMAYQIHNLTICEMDTGHLNDMVADYEKDIITYNPYTYDKNYTSKGRNFILNTFNNSVDADWIMESTRLIAVAGDDHTMYACGTEVVVSAEIYYIQYKNDGSIEFLDGVTLVPEIFDINEDHSEKDSSLQPLYVLPMLDKFHRAPRFATYGNVGIADINSDFGYTLKKCVMGFTGDLHFYTFASRDAIKRLHDTALLSIFDTTAAMNVK